MHVRSPVKFAVSERSSIPDSWMSRLGDKAPRIAAGNTINRGIVRLRQFTE